MKVVITEKPSVAIDIAKSLGKVDRKDGYLIVDQKYHITWAIGHLIEIDDQSITPKQWRKDTLPIIPSDFNYKVTDNKLKQFKVIEHLLKKAKEVIIATDAGREGELIARLIINKANYQGKLYRFWTSEALTKEVVQREFKSLKNGKDFESLYFSALGRQHADWLLGINMTRLATISSNDKSVWSIGRVQTPVLKIIVTRELEIRSFIPEPYWVVKAEFEKDGFKYEGILENNENKKSNSFFSKGKVDEIIKIVELEKQGNISKVKKETKKQIPPLLHSLTSLQKEANKLYSYPAKKTLDLAQELYEAKKISYPRTDAQYLDEQKQTKSLIKKVLSKLGKGDLEPVVDKTRKRVFDKSKLTDHYAIIPQELFTKKEIGNKNLSDEHYNIYILIARRLVGAFMPEYIYGTTSINTKVKNNIFISKGKVEQQLGWKELYKKDKKTKKEKPEVQLPSLEKGDIVEKIIQKLEEKKTKPADRYKESSILGSMEKLNLGTPATRASIIETLKNREYIELKKRNLIPKEKGIQLIENIIERDFVNPEMTTDWENTLDNIYKKNQGELGYSEFLNSMKKMVSKEVDQLKNVRLSFTSHNKCKACKKFSEEEKFFKCDKCESIIWKNFIGTEINLEEAKKLLSGKVIQLKKLKSKKGNVFDAMAHFINGRVELKFDNDNEIIGKCICEGNIIELNKLFKCDKCEGVVWKKFLEKDIPKEAALILFKNKPIRLMGLKSKSGNIFNAKARMIDGKIKLEFN